MYHITANILTIDLDDAMTFSIIHYANISIVTQKNKENTLYMYTQKLKYPRASFCLPVASVLYYGGVISLNANLNIYYK